MSFVDNDGTVVEPPPIDFDEHVPLERRQYTKFLTEVHSLRLRAERISEIQDGEWSVVQGMKNFLRTAITDLLDHLEPAARLYEMSDKGTYTIEG
jgi:hypothetical protein